MAITQNFKVKQGIDVSGTILTTTPSDQLKLAYDTSNHTILNTNSTGDLTITPTGGDVTITGDLTITGGDIKTGAAIASTLFNNTNTGNIAISTNLTTGTFTIGGSSSTGAVSLFPATGSQAITIGASTTGLITIGSTTSSAVQLPTGKTKIGQTTLVQGGAVSITLPTISGTIALDGHVHSTADITSGIINSARLGSGTANSTTYLRGDSTWQTISGGITIADDVSTNATYYPIFSTTATPGSVSTVDVSSTKLNFNPSTGNLSSTLFTSLSDISQKKDIVNISNSLEIISKLNPVYFRWKDNNSPSIGLIAQELETVLPELVETNKSTGLKSVNYNGLVAILISAIQELISKKES